MGYCRKNNVKYLAFASSSTVYGDAKIPTSEEEKINPISIYGASKAACEILINTYSKLYGIKSLILRYANIIGSRSKHGVIYDFIMKLKSNPNILEILGDGMQEKSYLHISDAIEATIKSFEKLLEINESLILNVGNEDSIKVIEIAKIVSKQMNLNPKFVFKKVLEDGRGWLGDVKVMLLSIEKLKN